MVDCGHDMPKPSYQLKQGQYAQIYQASERTIRNWMQKGAPLDDPHAMFADFLPGKRSLGAETRHADPLEVEARYQQARNPEGECHAIQAALWDRLHVIHLALMEARNFTRKFSPPNADAVATRLHTLMNEVEGVFELAGIGEDFVRPEHAREDLVKPVMLFAWPPGTRPAADDEDEGVGQQESEEQAA